jgi:hypothetical protein
VAGLDLAKETESFSFTTGIVPSSRSASKVFFRFPRGVGLDVLAGEQDLRDGIAYSPKNLSYWCIISHCPTAATAASCAVTAGRAGSPSLPVPMPMAGGDENDLMAHATQIGERAREQSMT